MKARVKATGKIVEVEKDNTDYPIMRKFGMTLNVYKDSQNLYNPEELEFLDDIKDNQNITEKSLPKDEPDYWEKLKHQYAGMAMQGIVSNPAIELDFDGNEACVQAVAQVSIKLATDLVNKLKEESQCEK